MGSDRGCEGVGGKGEIPKSRKKEDIKRTLDFSTPGVWGFSRGRFGEKGDTLRLRFVKTPEGLLTLARKPRKVVSGRNATFCANLGARVPPKSTPPPPLPPPPPDPRKSGSSGEKKKRKDQEQKKKSNRFALPLFHSPYFLCRHFSTMEKNSLHRKNTKKRIKEPQLLKTFLRNESKHMASEQPRTVVVLSGGDQNLLF